MEKISSGYDYKQKIRSVLLSFIDRFFIVILVVSFKLLIDLVYIYIISPYYSYLGMKYLPGTIMEVFISYFFVVILAFFIKNKTKKPFNFAFYYFYLFIYIPVSSLAYLNSSLNYNSFLILTVVFLFIGIINLFTFSVKLNFNKLEMNTNRLFVLIFLISIINLILIGLKFGFKVNFISLMDVYEVRAIFKEQLSSFYGYIINWQGNIFNIFILIYGIKKKNIIFILFAIVAQYFLFSISGFRSLFFSIIFVLWIIFGVKFYLRKMFVYITGTLIVSIITMVAVYFLWFDKGLILLSIFVRRLLFLPGLLYYNYLDFFSTHPFNLFAENLPFRWFIKSNYTLPLPQVIGVNYWGNPETDANANMFADGFANGGILGIVVIFLLLLFVLKLTDDFSYNKDKLFVYGLLAMPFFSLTNSSLLSTLLTHGLLISILIIMFLKKEDK